MGTSVNNCKPEGRKNKCLLCSYKMYDVGNINKPDLGSGWLYILYLSSRRMAVFKNWETTIICFLKACNKSLDHMQKKKFQYWFLHCLIKVLFCQCFLFWDKEFRMNICGMGDILKMFWEILSMGIVGYKCRLIWYFNGSFVMRKILFSDLKRKMFIWKVSI